jgi:hypothetical protein
VPDLSTEFDGEFGEEREGSAVLGLGSCSHCGLWSFHVVGPGKMLVRSWKTESKIGRD